MVHQYPRPEELMEMLFRLAALNSQRAHYPLGIGYGLPSQPQFEESRFDYLAEVLVKEYFLERRKLIREIELEQCRQSWRKLFRRI